MIAVPAELERRARQSLGRSDGPIYDAVARLLAERDTHGTLADVGCGTGELWSRVRDRFATCIGIDAVRYEGLPVDLDLRTADLDAAPLPIADASVDVAAAVEVVEHLENPRALVRELARVVKPRGWVIVTTPNQLSALSVLTLVARGRFAAFQDGDYPAHRTALLAVDLVRIARECGLRDEAIEYTGHGRVPLTPWHYPAALARLAPQRLSDNLMLIARR
ncbi:MAG: methyltransferase domain-containing protein [Acidobacteria bacterium]|nr:methyltransferase domain-containing protein [Acidobacteriota bacterium]